MSESTSSSGSSQTHGPGVNHNNATSSIHTSTTGANSGPSFASAVPPAPPSSPRKVAVPVLVKDGKTLV